MIRTTGVALRSLDRGPIAHPGQVESPAVCRLPGRFVREDFQHLVMRIICICEHFAGCET